MLEAEAIAAVRTLRSKSGAARKAAAEVLEKMRPFVARSDDAADLIARSGCHMLRLGENRGPEELYRLAQVNGSLKENPYFQQLKKVESGSVDRPIHTRRSG